MLENHIHGTMMGLNTINHFAIQYNVTLGRPLKSGQHAQSGGFTTTRRPEKRQKFTFADRKVQIAYSTDVAKAF
jgi:hypothetical protein